MNVEITAQVVAELFKQIEALRQTNLGQMAESAVPEGK